MGLTETARREATKAVPADKPALALVIDSLPNAWTRMSPHDLMQGAATLAMHYDRQRMAEKLRNRVLFSHHTDLMPNVDAFPEEVKEAFLWMVGRFEATMLGLAEQIENGMSE